MGHASELLLACMPGEHSKWLQSAETESGTQQVRCSGTGQPDWALVGMELPQAVERVVGFLQAYLIPSLTMASYNTL